MKNFEKFKDGGVSTNKDSSSCGSQHTFSETENHTQTSPGLSPFSLNLNDKIIGGSSSERPSGVKKSKAKRKLDDQTQAVINTLEEGNKQLLEQLKETNAQRKQQLEIQNKNFALRQLKEEHKILTCDLSSILDPNARVYIQAQKEQILQKGSLQQQEQQIPPSTSFGEYFKDLGGSGSDLPDF
ncbi:unnamed protein product [Cochlearia groenlandica]